MSPPPNATRAAARQPFLQNSAGWTFYPDAVEIAAGHWRGVVSIYPGKTDLTSRLHCVESRPSAGQALRDAQDFAWLVFRKIESRLGAPERPAGPGTGAGAARRLCH